MYKVGYMHPRFTKETKKICHLSKKLFKTQKEKEILGNAERSFTANGGILAGKNLYNYVLKEKINQKIQEADFTKGTLVYDTFGPYRGTKLECIFRCGDVTNLF